MRASRFAILAAMVLLRPVESEEPWLGESASIGQRLITQKAALEFKHAKLSRTLEVTSRSALAPILCDGRLTTLSGVPVRQDNTAGTETTLYFTPYRGRHITVYNGTQWELFELTEISWSIAGSTPNRVYDIFVYANTFGGLTLEASAAWVNTYTRTDALAVLDGVHVRASDNTRRYIGMITPSTLLRLVDTTASRNVWNMCNRVPRMLRRLESTDTWPSTTHNGFARVRSSTSSGVGYIVGVAGAMFRGSAHLMTELAAGTSGDGIVFSTGISRSGNSNHAQLFGGQTNPTFGASSWAEIFYYPAVGTNSVRWTETGNSTESWTYRGTNAPMVSGHIATIEG